jgi:hypothetical protein
MDHDEPTEFPPDGYAADDGWFPEPEEAQLPDLGLGYEFPGDDGVDPEVEGAGDPPDDGHLPGDTAPDHVGDVPELADDVTAGALAPELDPQEAVPGTDPDLNPFADDESWNVDPFPVALSFDEPPEPVDGMPWADPDLLGDPDGRLPDPAAGHQDPPPVAELYAYDATDPASGDPDPWASLVHSDDPATGSLARFWSTDPAP